ncbi:MAG: hypothetical protein ABI661_07915 [Gammaproteobacteria bacterium]
MSDEMSGDHPRGRVGFVQSGRPKFFADPVNDQLLAMITALLGEVCVLRERLDTVERVAGQRGLWQPEDVESYEPDPAAQQERDTLRTGALARVFSVLNEEVARLKYAASRETGHESRETRPESRETRPE